MSYLDELRQQREELIRKVHINPNDKDSHAEINNIRDEITIELMHSNNAIEQFKALNPNKKRTFRYLSIINPN